MSLIWTRKKISVKNIGSLVRLLKVKSILTTCVTLPRYVTFLHLSILTYLTYSEQGVDVVNDQ